MSLNDMHHQEEAEPPPLTGVLETVLYFTEPNRTERFYTQTLGMRLLVRDKRGHHLFFRAGSSIFLLFDASATQQGGILPRHGAIGEGHVCFQVPAESYEQWKRHLDGRGVELLHEAAWPAGRSFYFRDPDGNLLEIADTDIWPA